MHLSRYFAIAALTLLGLGCTNNGKNTNQDSYLKLKDAKETGVDFANMLTDNSALNIIEYLYYYNGGGVAVGDINNDGLDDIYFCGNQVSDKLYLNKGALKFEDISKNAKIGSNSSWSTGATMDDFNNDGYLDIYVSKVSIIKADTTIHNQLLINNRDNTFTDKSVEYGLNFRGLTTQTAFLDYDRDGDLDMYLLNHNIHSVNSYGNVDKRKEKDKFAGDRFYENQLKEQGKFIEVTEAAGIYNSPLGYGLAVAVSDVNNDGWPDIYVGNDFHENDYLYLNQGDKTFVESYKSTFSHTTQFSMGIDIVDMNNDGWNDIFTTDMMPSDEEVLLKSAGEDADQIKNIKKDLGFETQNARNHFQISNQDGTYADIAYLTRTFATDWSWSVLMQDFNNDTHQDIFISNGIVKRPNDLDYINFLNEIDGKGASPSAERTKRLIEKMPSQPIKNILFEGKGNLNYDQKTVGTPSFSTGAAYSDLDRDGDLDLITNNINQPAFVYENTTPKSNYISLSLKGDTSYFLTKGAKATLHAGDLTLTKELYTTRGFMSSSTHDLHFGLGAKTDIDSIVIVWADQKKQNIINPKPNQRLVVSRTANLKMYAGNPSSFDMVYSSLVYAHDENNFQDYNAEKLIPEKLSFEGPAMIHEDLNGDGIKDIFLGGGRNQAAKLLIGSASGKYSSKKTPDFETDAMYEDVDAALIDFDKDGDKDIYVVSGGSDNKELDKILEDRIYINNGNGVFKRIPISLPHTNGSCVSIGDYDGDGFEDIFVGARSIPGSYGLSPYSFVLKNLGGMGVDIGHQERYGMVTDGQWADVDGDKDLDLVICGDWMPITIVENQGNGKLVDKSKEYGTDALKGFWNTIECVDLNGDGVVDILAGNAGLNQKWTASDSLPILLYVADIDGNEESEPLIFYHYFNRYIPFYSLNKLTAQLPGLKKQYSTYASFVGVKGIEDISKDYKSKLTESKTVNELRSMLFLSKGKKYIATPLLARHQWGDIQDFAVDSDQQIYYVGSARKYVSELGASSGNRGMSLGTFDKSSSSFVGGKYLPFPVGISPKKLSITQTGRLVIASNNGELAAMTLKVMK